MHGEEAVPLWDDQAIAVQAAVCSLQSCVCTSRPGLSLNPHPIDAQLLQEDRCRGFRLQVQTHVKRIP